MKIYQQGYQSGINRRESDGRFYARGEGQALNSGLAKLNSNFEAITDEIMQIKLKSAYLYQQQASECLEWRRKSNLTIAFRSAVAAYIGCAVAFGIYDPTFLQRTSQFVAQHVWPYVFFLRTAYGPLVLASMLSIVTFLISKSAMSERGIERGTDHINEERDNNIDNFVAAEIEPSPDEVGSEAGADAESVEKDDDSRSPYEILGLPNNATRDQIIAAHRVLIMQYHSDFQQNRGPKLKQLAERESQKLNWAKDEALK